MSTHTPSLVRPSTYEVAYECSCGWGSETVPSDQMAAAGRQLVAHMSEGRIPHTPTRPHRRSHPPGRGAARRAGDDFDLVNREAVLAILREVAR